MGSFRRTSRSRLFDRVVRVDRNRPVDDGLGGGIDSFTTIIDQYWVTIFPAQHQERRRAELGTEETNRIHYAIGNPPVNGRTIMITDRFVDEVNNQAWDVMSVIRPMAHGHAAVHRFQLRLIADDREVVS